MKLIMGKEERTDVTAVNPTLWSASLTGTAGLRLGMQKHLTLGPNGPIGR